MIQKIFSRSARTFRLTFHFRFGCRWVNLLSQSQSATHRSVMFTLSGGSPRFKQHKIYSWYNCWAFTLNASFGKRHMIFISTECRIMLYHMKSPSRTGTGLRGAHCPKARRRYHRRFCSRLLSFQLAPRGVSAHTATAVAYTVTTGRSAM